MGTYWTKILLVTNSTDQDSRIKATMSNCMSDLPEELLILILILLLILILSKIFGKDRLQRCRALVCKDEAILGSPPYHSFPCLTFYQRNINNLCSTSTSTTNKKKSPSPSPLCRFFQYNRFFSIQISNKNIHINADILCSKYGWLLMSHNELDLFLFHPFHNKIINLPAPFMETYRMFSFYNPPTSSDCVIIGLQYTQSSPKNNRGVRIGVLKLKDLQSDNIREWNHYESNSKKMFYLSYCIPILHHGSLYFMDVKGNIGTFNLEEKTSSGFRFHSKCLSPARLRDNLKQRFLIKVHGEDDAILAVFVDDRKKLRVYRLLESDMKWQLVEDLGGMMLFLGRAGSFAKKAPINSMANNIYLTKFYGKSGVFYSLKTKKYHSIDGSYNSRTSYGLAESFAAWITT